jgi:hypothetical protein
VAVAVGFTSLPVPSVFLTSGDAVDFGVEAGEAAGEPLGLATGEFKGDAAGGVVTVLGFVTTALFEVPEQAPNTATLAAKTVDKINDLLIVFSSLLLEHADVCPQNRHPQPD